MIKHSKGFTLTEVAIALIVLGTLLTLTSTWFLGSIKTSKTTQQKKAISSIEAQILNYIKYQDEFIPINAITDNKDIFGIEYVIYNATLENICELDTTDLSVDMCVEDNCSTFTRFNDVAFVLSSNGLNRKQEIIADEDITNIRLFEPQPIVHNIDDISTFYTLSQLKNFVGCTSIDNTLRFLNTSIPAVNYNAAVDNTRIFFTNEAAGNSSESYRVCYSDNSDDFDSLGTDYLIDNLTLTTSSNATVPACPSSISTDGYVNVTTTGLSFDNSTYLAATFVLFVTDDDNKEISGKYHHQVYIK